MVQRTTTDGCDHTNTLPVCKLCIRCNNDGLLGYKINICCYDHGSCMCIRCNNDGLLGYKINICSFDHGSCVCICSNSDDLLNYRCFCSNLMNFNCIYCNFDGFKCICFNTVLPDFKMYIYSKDVWLCIAYGFVLIMMVCLATKYVFVLTLMDLICIYTNPEATWL